MDRRQFVWSVAGIPFVSGARSFQIEGQSLNRRGDALERGLEQMKALQRPGLVFVLPKDPAERKALGCALFNSGVTRDYGPLGSESYLLSRAESVNREHRFLALTATCVLICLEENEAAMGLRTRAPRLVLDSKGKVLRWLEKVPANLEIDLIPEISELVQGADLQHLKARVDTLRSELSSAENAIFEAFIEELQQLSPTSLREHLATDLKYQKRLTQARQWLATTPALAQWLAWVFLRAKSESVALRELLESPGPHLPHGCVLPTFVATACSNYREVKPGEARKVQQIGYACGLTFPTLSGRRYLRFVGDK